MNPKARKAAPIIEARIRFVVRVPRVTMSEHPAERVRPDTEAASSSAGHQGPWTIRSRASGRSYVNGPEELRLKKLELSRAESRVHHFIELIASGRATPALADALA
jgi:hypothetical protein